MKLTQDEKESLAEIVGSPAFAALLKAVDALIEKQGERVLSATDSELASERKKFDGMKSLRHGIESLRGK